jgi:hypothetical protein
MCQSSQMAYSILNEGRGWGHYLSHYTTITTQYSVAAKTGDNWVNPYNSGPDLFSATGEILLRERAAGLAALWGIRRLVCDLNVRGCPVGRCEVGGWGRGGASASSASCCGEVFPGWLRVHGRST